VYKHFFKRFLDILLSTLVLLVFWWVYVILAILVKTKLGSPVIHRSNRVGKDGKVFCLYKFRSMTNETDENGKLLPDARRLTKFGRVLRATSLDELPELINIIKGDMSIIGPRPMPPVYLPYFTATERKRHTVRPGLSGWAQVNGRNSVQWTEKFRLDVWYVEHLSFVLDVKIIVKTFVKVIKHDDIGQGEEAPKDFNVERGDWILTDEGALDPKEGPKV
jgi:undecaprenyl phosphate N,N'-diacetylbacillosamine 1-phosphate transferase